jgi:hypothetical protein
MSGRNISIRAFGWITGRRSYDVMIQYAAIRRNEFKNGFRAGSSLGLVRMYLRCSMDAFRGLVYVLLLRYCCLYYYFALVWRGIVVHAVVWWVLIGNILLLMLTYTLSTPSLKSYMIEPKWRPDCLFKHVGIDDSSQCLPILNRHLILSFML